MHIAPFLFIKIHLGAFSWTFITWIVIVGSTLLVLLWITVYSYLTTGDFTNEVELLFSTADFWLAVILSVVLAVGKFGFQEFV